MANNKKFGRDLSIAAGNPFIPYKIFFGGYLPEPIMESTTLTATEKVCWAKLNQFSGKNGFCYPSLSLMAKSIGVSVRQVIRVLNGLVEKGFIQRKTPNDSEKGQYQSTCYSFLWHTNFDDAVLMDQDNSSDKISISVATSNDHAMNNATPSVIGIMPPSDMDAIKAPGRNMYVSTPPDADVIPPPVINVTHPPDTCVRHPSVMDGTRNGSYIKENIEVDHMKRKGEGNPLGFPSPFSRKTPSQPLTAFEKEKSALLERYSDSQRITIEFGIAGLKKTRANGNIPDEVLLTELRRWNEVPVEHVIQGIRLYVGRRCYLRKKNEHYLWGIIRNLCRSASKEESDPDYQPEPLPVQDIEAFTTILEWLQETTGENHDSIAQEL